MRKALLIPALLGLALAACKTMGTQSGSTTGTTCPTELPAIPTAPTVVTIPDTGTVPTVPASSQIVVVVYPRGRGYAAAGVDTRAQRFTFVFQGGEETLPSALSRFYATHTPVAVYTAPLKLVDTAQPSPLVPPEPPPSPAPTSVQGIINTGTGPTTNATCDVCDPISDDPGGTKKPGGDEWLPVFLKLSWYVSLKLATVVEPLQTGPLTGAP